MLADSSVWIDAAVGRTGWRVTRLRHAISRREAMIVDPVRLEVLAGLRLPREVDRMTAAFDGCEDVMQLHKLDAESAADIFRTCRRGGETIRSLNDCLIAAIAIRNDVPVLHRDRDYDAIARRFPLRVVQE